MISHQDWSVQSEIKDEQTCIHAHINDKLDIDKLEFTLLDEERKLIMRMKVNTREIYFCTAIGKPVFAQLGDCVKFVDGTGAEIYTK